MSVILNSSSEIPWWKEPSKEQWKAWIAAWLGWTLDAFDFTIFLLIMVPIAKEFDVSLTAVAVVFTITSWLRLVGATAAGWMADRMGRKTPLKLQSEYQRMEIPVFLQPLHFCSFSARCSALGWALSGRPVRPLPWNPGQRAPAAS